MAEKLSIGFLGAGKMGTALAKGFIAAGLTVSIAAVVGTLLYVFGI